MTMTLKKIRWASFLGPHPPLPFDVSFNVIEDERVTARLGAHRCLLATCSPVFRTEFFGLLAENEKVIEIKETSQHAFYFLLNYIYGASLEPTADMGALQLFEILNLAERYDMARLKAEVTECLEQLRMKEEDVLGVARVAEAFSHFEAVSGAVLASCSRLLKDVIVSDTVREEFCHTRLQYPEDSQLVDDLLQRVEEQVEEDDEDIGDIIKDLFESEPSAKTVIPKEVPTNLYNVSWVDLLEPGSGIPPDVRFRIIGTPSETSGGECRELGEVFAHRYLLAAASQAFNKIFFGDDSSESEAPSGYTELATEEAVVAEDLREEAGMHTVDVQCSSMSAFKVMIEYMYGKYPTLRGAEEICEIFEIIDLAERFLVTGLEEEYRTAMFLYFREKPRWSSHFY